MDRRTNTPVEGVITWLAAQPWWMNLVIGCGAYFGFNALAVAPPDAGVGARLLHGLAGLAQYALPGFCLIGSVKSLFARQHREQLVHNVTRSGAQAVNDMSWQDFESLVGEAFRLAGYQVRETGGGGPDGGVDLELRQDGELSLVQCKQWRAYRWGVGVVRELYGVMAARGADGGYVVTSGRFTQDARKFAQGRNIILIDGDELQEMLDAALMSTGQRPEPPQPRHDAKPDCPLCGCPMTRRVARQGNRAGEGFWGCTRFPDCKGMVRDGE